MTKMEKSILNKILPEYGELNLDARIRILVNPGILFSWVPSLLNPITKIPKLNISINGKIDTNIKLDLIEKVGIEFNFKSNLSGLYKFGLIVNDDTENISNEVEYSIRPQIHSLNINTFSIAGYNHLEIYGDGFNETTTAILNKEIILKTLFVSATKIIADINNSVHNLTITDTGYISVKTNDILSDQYQSCAVCFKSPELHNISVTSGPMIGGNKIKLKGKYFGIKDDTVEKYSSYLKLFINERQIALNTATYINDSEMEITMPEYFNPKQVTIYIAILNSKSNNLYYT